MSELTETLVAAQDHLKNGWAQIDYDRPIPRWDMKAGNGPRYDCVYTALESICGLKEPLFTQALNLLGFQTVREACDWNDQDKRTHEEVLGLYEVAIDKSCSM